MKNLLRLCVFILLLGRTAAAASPLAVPTSTGTTDVLSFSEKDRVLVLAPHPDDEILGTAGVIQRAQKAKAQIKIVFLTYGDFNAWSFTVYRKHPVLLPSGMRAMGETRRKEAINASRVLQLTDDQLLFLGYPDHGTLQIWCYNWQEDNPYRSSMTHARGVPYKDAYRYQAPYTGESVLDDLTKIIRDYRPTKIFVTHPADQNPDHRAAYLFLRVALWDLEKVISPTVYPFLIHYRFRHWPVPQGYHPDKPLLPPKALTQTVSWTPFPLEPDEIPRKYEALRQHKSQYEYSGKYLASFVRTNELFGDYPVFQLKGSEKVQLEKGDTMDSVELPEEYAPEEKAAFVDLDHRLAYIENGNLVLTTVYDKPFKEKFRFDLYLFGYRADKPFAEMPKIRVEIRKNKAVFFNIRTKLPITAIEVIREPHQLTVKTPLELLGDPQRILTGIQTSLEEVPLDVMSWRLIYLQ